MTGGPPGGGGRPRFPGRLQRAQAHGDRRALRGRGRPVVRPHLDRGRGIAQLPAAAGTYASGAFS